MANSYGDGKKSHIAHTEKKKVSKKKPGFATSLMCDSSTTTSGEGRRKKNDVTKFEEGACELCSHHETREDLFSR